MAAQHHVLDRRGGDALLQRVGEVLDDDDGLGAGVLQLVLQLARRVQRVDVHHHEAGAQDGGHGHRVLRHVGHHDGDAVALGQAQALQVGGEGAAQRIGLAVGDVLAHEAVGGAAAYFWKLSSISCTSEAYCDASMSAGTPGG
jgi:hypothetical protein